MKYVTLLCVMLCFISSSVSEEPSVHGVIENRKLEEDESFSSKSHGGTVSHNDYPSETSPTELRAASNETATTMMDNTNMMKSTEKRNDEISAKETTVTVSIPFVNPTTLKIDPKKDTKKKNKLTFKKKDKHLDFASDRDFSDISAETKEKIAEHNLDDSEPFGTVRVSAGTTEDVPETTMMPQTATKIVDDEEHMSEDNEDVKNHKPEDTLGITRFDETTEINTNTMETMSNKQPQTTIANHLLETTVTPHLFEETMDAGTHQTNPTPTEIGRLFTDESLTTLNPQETTTEILIVTEDNEMNLTVPTTVSDIHIHVNPEIDNAVSTRSDDNAKSVPLTTETAVAEDSSLQKDNNSLSNDLQKQHEVTTAAAPTEGVSVGTLSVDTPSMDRKQKQMNLEHSKELCLCDEPKMNFDSSKCLGERTTLDPNCFCRSICARQSGESCSPVQPCDAEFGLQCNFQNNSCQGQLSISVFDISHNSARVKWGTDHSELQPQALVSYSTTYRGPHTVWTKVNDIKPVTVLDTLVPGKTYFLKVEENGKQEISVFKTKESYAGNMPKILVKQRSQTTLTVVWDDFRLPSYHSEYILEYRPAEDISRNWTKVQAGTQTIVTVTHLKPNTPYQIKVAVWEDEKLELPSEVITAYTADGCVRENRMYNVNEEFSVACESQCMCSGNNITTCNPRCHSPYVKLGSVSDPLCYEKPIETDSCCAMVICSNAAHEEKKDDESTECPEILEEIESETESCLSDCDHDGDCSGLLKCCPSSCGGAVCVMPKLKKGNMTNDMHNETHRNGTLESEFEIKVIDGMETTPQPVEARTIPDSESRNELESEEKESKETPTEAPFQLDLTSNKQPHTESPNSENITLEVPNDEENFHHRRPQDKDPNEKIDDSMNDHFKPETAGEDMPKMEDKNFTADGPLLFDGCEYNNITYDRGVRFEDGCDAYCMCGGQGHVSCVPRCTVLSSGGPACREVPDPDDACCKIMVCSFPGSSETEKVDSLPLKILSALAQNGTSVRVRVGLSMSQLPAMVGRDMFEVWFRESSDSDNDLSQWNKKLITQNELTEVQQGVFEFDINDLRPQTDYYIKVGKESQGATNLNIAEFSNTVNVKTFPAAVKTVFQGCFHHNQSYSLGEIFYQGCEHKCICREKGFIECQERCEIYIDTVGYEGCDWVTSEEDPCCTIPSCQRRKIPLLPDGRTPFMGNAENMCVVDTNEVYRVGDIWESGDGCKMKICRCTLLSNGSTSIQCQSECPPLPPNAHIPTARCPHPVLIKPDGPCSCPYVGCNEAPRRIVQPPRPQCEFKGQRYDMGQEFHDECIALCHCGQDLRVSCAAIECPYHFSAEFTNCLEWDIDPDFFPSPPHCCAPAKCKNDGSCTFSGRKFENFQDIPSELLSCGARCVCVNSNVTCENRCPPIEDVPPINLPCSPNLAYKGHPEGETCCLQWMCKEPLKQSYCMFQGARYLVSEQWEVRKNSQHRLCTCHLNPVGEPEVECKGGCPQIPQRFLLPTEQCLRPVIVTPDDPVMCPYVVCNNTLSGQELYNVNVVALNSTAVRIRFSLSSILVGLIGHAELHFTTDPTLPPTQWHIQKFSRPKRLFDSPNIEYILNALRPNTTYFLQVKIKIDALQGGPESEIFKLRMPEEIISTTTTTIPPMMIIDPKAEVHVIDAKTVRISWRNFEPQEKKFIYALQLKYKLQNEADDKWITTPMIHRDVSSYFLHDLEPSADYVVDILFTPPKDLPTKIMSSKPLEFHTTSKKKDNYHLQIAVENNKVGEESSAFTLAGIPEPITKYVHVVKILYKTSDSEQSFSFKVPKTNQITLDHLKPGKKYLAQIEVYLTNGQTLTSNEVEFITKPAKLIAKVSHEENTINSHTNGKQAEPLHSNDSGDDENRAYFIALVVVAVVAAVAGFGFVLLLVLLVRRQASAKAPISRTPSESAYDNPTYKTYDGERPEDKTNGQTIQTTQA